MIYQVFISNHKSEIFISNKDSKFLFKDLFFIEAETPEIALEKIEKLYCKLVSKQKLKEVYSSFKLRKDEHEVKGVIFKLKKGQCKGFLNNNPESTFLKKKELYKITKRPICPDLKKSLNYLLDSNYFSFK